MTNNPDLRPYYHGEHEMGRKMHSTEMYKKELEPNVVAYWSICPECKVVRTKKVITYMDKDVRGYGTAYIYDIVKGGQRV